MLEVQLIVEHLFNIYKDLDSISGSRINREGDTSELVVSVLYKIRKSAVPGSHTLVWVLRLI